MSEYVKDIVTMMLGYLAGNFTTVVSYFFGSSKSSADNKGMMAILQDKLIPPTK
jgi:hypothetical protein